MSIISSRSGFQIRPRFEISSPMSSQEIFDRSKEALQHPDNPYIGQAREGFVTIYPNSDDHHVWSPHLSVSIEEEGDGSLLRGHYGPSPIIWTLYVLIYSVIALLTLIVTVIGVSHLTMGESASILWTIPVLVLIFGSLYFVSSIGQKKGHDQLMDIHHLFEDIIDQQIK